MHRGLRPLSVCPSLKEIDEQLLDSRTRERALEIT